MRTVCAILCGISLLASWNQISPAQAAEIKSTRLSQTGELADVQLITIIGDIKEGDDAKFRRLSVIHDKAIVALESEGGMLVPAIEIGKLIRIKEYPTLVLNGDVCTSSCALIWIAGSRRYLAPRARVGFHASYRDVGGRQQETGLGNALVGRYLTLLNLPEKAVIFATAASPEEILWLNSANMREAGIEFEELGNADTAPPPLVRRDISPTSNSNARIQRGWQHVATGGDTKYYLDRSRMHRVGRFIAAWELADESRNSDVEHFESKKLNYYDCQNRKAALREVVHYDSNGRVLKSFSWNDRETTWDGVVPDTVGESKLNYVCRSGL